MSAKGASKSRMLNQKMAGAVKPSTAAVVALKGMPRWAREGGGGTQGHKERVDAAVPGSAPNRCPCSSSRLQPHPVMPRMPAKEKGERPPEMGAAARPKGGRRGDRGQGREESSPWAGMRRDSSSSDGGSLEEGGILLVCRFFMRSCGVCLRRWMASWMACEK